MRLFESNNVNSCAKLCELYMTTNLATEKDKIIKKIIDIADANRVVLFRGKSFDEIKNILEKLQASAIEQIKQKFCKDIPNAIVTLKMSSSSNRDGADAIATIEQTDKKIDVEFKFGSETNSNLGMAKVKKFISSVNNIKTGNTEESFISKELGFDYIPSSTRKKWAQYIIAGKMTIDDFIKARNKLLNKFIEKYNSMFSETEPVDEDTQELLFSTINSSGGKGITGDGYIKLIGTASGFKTKDSIDSCTIYRKHIAPVGTKLECENNNSLRNRLHIIFEGNLTSTIDNEENKGKIIIDNIFNFKNTYKLKMKKNENFVDTDEIYYNPIKGRYEFQAKLGLGTPSFNCFVKIQ